MYTVRKRWVAVLLTALLAAMVLSGCSSSSYTKEGEVTLTDRSEQTHKVQIAEIQEKKDKTVVYVRGSSDFAVCDYKMGSHGYGWEIHMGLKVQDESGTKQDPEDVTPYMTGKSSGNTLGFEFEGTGYTTLYLYLEDNEDNGVEVPIEELQLSEDLKMSDMVKKLQ
jgi:hypothetical protein